MRAKKIYLIVPAGLVAVVFWLTCCQVPKQPTPVDIQEVESTKGPRSATDDEIGSEPNIVEAPTAESTDSNIVERACALIYRGEFDAAGDLIEHVPFQYDSNLHQLTQIVREYQAINQRRQSAREAAYAEKLAELEKLRAAADANDVNDIPKVLSVIASVVEFADGQQKAALLSDSFVKQVFQKARDKAAEFESRGEWLDAYITCYSWLQTIVPDNKEYSDYTEQLAAKANISVSFQDSPCESFEARHRKVKKEMFVRAIEALNFNYVSDIDYRQMATEALRHCELLAEVVGSPSFEEPQTQESELGDPEGSFSRPDNEELTAWSAILKTILDGVNRSSTDISKDEFIGVFEKVLALNTVTVELPTSVLVAHFAEAAFSALDPYTVMVWPRQVQNFEKMMTNEFTGIGIEISKQKGRLTVASLLPDTPAYNSGLDARDVIEAVDRLETKDMSLGCAVRKITGPAGTDVTLTIRRAGEEKTKDITITRAKIVVPTIRGWQRTGAGKWLYMIDEADKIGYVRITSFSGGTASALEKVLSQIESEGLRGLILDLRFNSGGLLDSAIEVSDKFVEDGLIVSTRPRWQTGTYVAAQKENAHPNYPLVVLINRYSASASEIVAGVLADKMHNRAILVGERTHGKGSVQGITHYPGGGAQLKYTMAHYHLPSGERVESRDAMKKQGRKDWGIGPNIEVKLGGGVFPISDEEKKMMEVQRDNDVLVKADHDTGSAPLKKYTAEETLAADPHLAVGVLVVKTKLIEGSEKLKQGSKEQKGTSAKENPDLCTTYELRAYDFRPLFCPMVLCSAL